MTPETRASNRLNRTLTKSTFFTTPTKKNKSKRKAARPSGEEVHGLMTQAKIMETIHETVVTVDSFLGRVGRPPQPWWTLLVAKAIGFGVILAACMIKLPIIINLQRTKSSSGLSRASFYSETIVFANLCAYGFLSGFPLTAYGENAAGVVQNIVILLMMWKYTDSPAVSRREQSFVVATVVVYIGIIAILPRDMNSFLLSSLWPVILYSKCAQLWTTYLVKHSGAYSILTILMNVLGAATRIATTIAEVGMDIGFLWIFVLSLALNLIHGGLYCYYLRNTERFLRERLNAQRDVSDQSLPFLEHGGSAATVQE